MSEATQNDLSKLSLEQLQAKRAANLRLIAAKKAQASLIAFSKFMEPDPNAPDDVTKSLYVDRPHHHAVAQALERVESGEFLAQGVRYLLISIGPQKGKSQLCTRNFPAWAWGRNPKRNLMIGSYNDDFARNFGDDVRSIMLKPQYLQVFPRSMLRKGGKAKDYMVTEAGGKGSFIGRGGSGTGKPADIFIIDDPIKNDDEANSLTIRNTVWNWFLKVADSRTHGNSMIVIIQTRWHEDDLIGRLTDKTNPHYPEAMAKMCRYINIPSIIEKEHEELGKALGLKVGESIWEEKFPLWLLKIKKDADPRGFGALEMGRPVPPDGAFYKAEQIRACWYKSVADLPKGLRKYGSGDLAVSDDTKADSSVIGDWGLDENDILWLLPDLYWTKRKADATVEYLVTKGKDNWQTFFGEKGQIDRSIRPFLEKRMMETECYFGIETFPTVNKGQASLSFRGRLAQGRVRLPVFAEWYQRAEEQMLKFTGSGDDKEDDFCDMLARIGQGLQMQVRGSGESKLPSNVHVIPGTGGWMYHQYHDRKRAEKKHAALRGC